MANKVDTEQPYRIFNESMERGQRLYNQAARKWLNLPTDMGDINVKQGFGWKELLVIAAMLTGLAFATPQIIQTINQNVETPAPAEPVDPGRITIDITSRVIPPEGAPE